MPKHVSFETPIDWRQWKLDQAIRSLRMWVDGEGDLYAVPVVVVDPTGAASSATLPQHPCINWENASLITNAGVNIIAQPTAGQYIKLYGMKLDFSMTADAGGPAHFRLIIEDYPSGVGLFALQIYVAAAAYNHEIVLNFLPSFLTNLTPGSSINARWFAPPSTATVRCDAWGRME